MANLRPDKNHAPGGNFTVFGSGFKAGFAAKNVIDFIFAVGLLAVGITCGEYVQTGAHLRHPEELTVGLAACGALFLDFGEAGKKGLHANMPPKIRSVN